jgi:hypothetical protein
MKTAGRGNPNNWAYSTQHPSPWRGSSEQISLDHVGWEGRKILAGAIVFLLDFPLYRTSQDLSGLDETVRSGNNFRADDFSGLLGLRC